VKDLKRALFARHDREVAKMEEAVAKENEVLKNRAESLFTELLDLAREDPSAWEHKFRQAANDLQELRWLQQ